MKEKGEQEISERRKGRGKKKKRKRKRESGRQGWKSLEAEGTIDWYESRFHRRSIPSSEWNSCGQDRQLQTLTHPIIQEQELNLN